MSISPPLARPTPPLPYSLLGRVGVVGSHLDLDPHRGLPQARHADAGPDGLVVGHVGLEVADHGGEGLVAQGDVVRVDAEDLGPALAAGVLEVQLHVLEGLVDLRVDVAGDLPRRGVPAAFFTRKKKDLVSANFVSSMPVGLGQGTALATYRSLSRSEGNSSIE